MFVASKVVLVKLRSGRILTVYSNGFIRLQPNTICDILDDPENEIVGESPNESDCKYLLLRNKQKFKDYVKDTFTLLRFNEQGIARKESEIDCTQEHLLDAI